MRSAAATLSSFLLFLALFAPACTYADNSEASSSIALFETRFRDGRSIYGSIEERMALHKVPGMSIAVIQGGHLSWAKGYGVIQAGSEELVNTATVFSVGSLSKVVAAALTLRLVDVDELDLSRNVNDYLDRWKVQDNQYTEQRPVTLRSLLSHTAGFNVHGFPDFQPGEALPSVIDTLEGKFPASNPPVAVKFTPGSQFSYSGGGVTVEQLVIEDITSLDFQDAARKHVFEPLNMTRSTFQNPIPKTIGNIAKAHDANGKPRALPRGWEAMPEMAASGLWTTPSDYARLLIALIQSYQAHHNPFISAGLAKEMMSPVSPGQYGLGPRIHSNGELFSHGGSNDSYKAFMIANLKTGNGIVVFTNGANGERIGTEVVNTMRRIEQW